MSAISSSYALPQLSQLGNTQPTGSIAGDSDGDNDGSRASEANRGPGGPGAFLDAIFQALSQAGVSGSTATTNAVASTSSTAGISSTAADTSSSQNPLQALGTFMHDLLTALQTQGGQATPQGGSDSDGDNDGSGSSSVSGHSAGHHHHHGGLGRIESNLQSLITQLTSTPPSSAADGSGPTASSTSPGTTLQQDYQNLLSSLGASGGSSSLGSFLQALSQNLQSLGSAGNLVNTQA